MSLRTQLAKWQPAQLYIVLVLTVLYFLTELIISHTTHSLTLLMDSYHMLCNIIALTSCILSIKHSTHEPCKDANHPLEGETVGAINATDVIDTNKCKDKKNFHEFHASDTETNQMRKLKNTFGWARIDVMFMLICFVFLASLSFSLIVEALQTLVHIDHQDEMHQPIVVLCVGSFGILLNGICYLLIGGYTFHQGSFLYVTESGDVVLNGVVSGDSVKKGGRRLSRTRNTVMPAPPKQRQGFREMARDILGSLFVIGTSLMVYFTAPDVAKFIDPTVSIVSATLIIYLSYPYMKESCLILLQTIPDTINIDSLKTQLIEHFPDIVNIHDLHIWQLTTNKVISTVHIIFDNPKVYDKLINDLREFFTECGITQVTIQPEFYCKSAKSISLESITSEPSTQLCLMACQKEECLSSQCCQKEEVLSGILNSSSMTDLKISNATVDKNGSLEDIADEGRTVKLENIEICQEICDAKEKESVS